MTYENIIGVEEVKERFMGNFNMFSMYLYQFAEGALYHKLLKAVEAGELKAAFETAHDMKGVVMNLSLKPMEQPIVSVVEALREGNVPDEALWKTFQESYRITAEAIETLKKEGTILF